MYRWDGRGVFRSVLFGGVIFRLQAVPFLNSRGSPECERVEIRPLRLMLLSTFHGKTAFRIIDQNALSKA